jgi:hypothetical protein
MGLAFNVGGGGLVLRVQRVELLVEAVVGRDPREPRGLRGAIRRTTPAPPGQSTPAGLDAEAHFSRSKSPQQRSPLCCQWVVSFTPSSCFLFYRAFSSL